MKCTRLANIDESMMRKRCIHHLCIAHLVKIYLACYNPTIWLMTNAVEHPAHW